MLRKAALAALRMSRLIDKVGDYQPVREPKCRFNRICETPSNIFLHDEPVNDHRNVVLDVLFERRWLAQRNLLTVNKRTRETHGLHLPKQVAVFALATPHDGSKHLEARALRHTHKLIHDLLRCLRSHRIATYPAL